MKELEYVYDDYDEDAENEKTLSEYDDTVEPKVTIIPKKIARAKDYEQVCHDLGFNPDVKFVKITTRGTISFTAGKSDEICALYRAVRDSEYIPAKSLINAINKL